MPTRSNVGRKVDNYTDFVRSLELVIIALTGSTFRIKRDEYFKGSHDLVVEAGFKPKKVAENHFDLQAELKVKLVSKKSTALLELTATYELHFHGEPPLDAKLVRRFAESDARLVVWPYFREYVSDVSARMYVPPILLPLSK